MRHLLPAFGLSMLLSIPLSAATFTLGGTRPAKLYSPEGTAPRPMIVFLHGYTSNEAQINLLFNANKEDERLGFATLYPVGSPDAKGKSYWNATPECCNFGKTDRDDVAYIEALIAEAKTKIAVTDVYLIGHSNGGFMAHRMACEKPELFKGIASMAGGLYRDVSLCKHPGSVPILQIHGTHDTTIPYDTNEKYSSARETVSKWAKLYGCDDPVEKKKELDLAHWNVRVEAPKLGKDQSIKKTLADAKENEKETDTLTYDHCKNGSRVALWTVNGSGHVINFAGVPIIEKIVDYFKAGDTKAK